MKQKFIFLIVCLCVFAAKPAMAEEVDKLLQLAREACGKSEYMVADSILREASMLLVRSSEMPSSSLPHLQKYAATIVSMYTELFPLGFHVPKDIYYTMFSHHLLNSLTGKSSGISSQDSAYFVSLANRLDITYDIPIMWNDRVKETFLFFLKRRKVLFDRWFYHVDYYIPVMKQMFIDAGLPGDLAYLPILESHFDPHAYSSANAAGIWQFISSTGRQYGLRQNYWIDERRDPLKATGAAINYLDKLYGDFKNWHTALASYNCGEKRMLQAIIKAGGTNNFWALSLPKESMNYVPFFISTLIIAKNHNLFEFGFPETEGTFDLDTVLVNDCVEMKTIAEGIGISLDSLTKINPHILRGITPPDMRDVRIYLPNGYAAKFKEFYSSLPDDKKTKFYHYTVKKGENLTKIANIFNVDIDTLRKINNIKAKSTAVDKYVIVPISANDTVPSSLASHLNVSEWESPGQTISYCAISRVGKKVIHKVGAGETLQSISKAFDVTEKDLLAWNYLANPRDLKSGRILSIYLPDSLPDSQPDSSAQIAQAADSVGGNAKYSGKRVVKPGETFYGISLELGIPPNELATINGLNVKCPQISVGYILRYNPNPAPANKTNGVKSATLRNPSKPSNSLGLN